MDVSNLELHIGVVALGGGWTEKNHRCPKNCPPWYVQWHLYNKENKQKVPLVIYK